MSDVIEIIPKTEIRFNGRMNSTQFVVLAERIPTVAYASGALEVLLFSVDAGMSTTASAFVEVVNESEAPEDPGAFFVGTVTLASVQIQSTTAAPSVLPAALSTPIGSMVRVRVKWTQGATEADIQTITIAVNLVMRMGA